ncbi:MAG: RraA family protein [Sedimentisphaerales bacterium]|nr:RraA family protein [Sedimentisphaerales bacterium]
MKIQKMFFAILLSCLLVLLVAASAVEKLREGMNYIPTKVYTLAQDQEILKAYEGLRVADVADGMDRAGLTHIGRMSFTIHPSWTDTVHYKHRFIGIAVTVRYVPTNVPAPRFDSSKEFDEWVGKTYNESTSEPFTALLRPGSALVIDEAPNMDVGSIGSNNIMGWKTLGCVGVVTDGTARDTDEVATEQVPLYLRNAGKGIRPGRNLVESVNRPIVCGDVLVEPGDVIVADGDGVVVVPRVKAKLVAKYAHETLDKDKAGRKSLYKKLGLPMDDSVK